MKNLYKLIGIIALVAVIGFSVASCNKGGGGGKDALSGTTWKYDDLVLTFKSPNWTIKQNGKEIIKGTYTISDGQVTISFPDKGTTETRSIAGETLNISGFTFKKQ